MVQNALKISPVNQLSGHFVAKSWSKPKTYMQNGCLTDSKDEMQVTPARKLSVVLVFFVFRFVGPANKHVPNGKPLSALAAHCERRARRTHKGRAIPPPREGKPTQPYDLAKRRRSGLSKNPHRA